MLLAVGLGEQPIKVADPKSEAPSLGLSDLVVLAPDYARHSDAREGPLSPGQIGVVVEVGSSRLRVKARSGDDRKWWCVLSKLQHCLGARVAAFLFVPLSCG